MRTRNYALITCALALIISLPVNAANLYIGGSAAVSLPTGKFAGEEIEINQGAANRGTGLQAEIGMNGDIYDVYFSVREDNFPADAIYYGFDIDGEWKAPRLIYGARLHLSEMTKSTTDPLLGMAFTYGATTAKASIVYSGDRLTEKQTTLHSPGLMFETGVVFDVGKSVRGIFTLQYHSFAAELEDFIYDDFNNDYTIEVSNVDVTYVTFNLGLRFKIL